MTSYTRLSTSIFADVRRIFKIRAIAAKRAEAVYDRSMLAQKHIYDCYRVKWQRLHLLEIGCGQDLSYTQAFARHNRITAIDTELPLRSPYVRNLWDLVRYSGCYRAIRSVAGEISGKRRSFSRALRRIVGSAVSHNITLSRMDACDLDFPDESFDGVFSFSVFEHIDKPKKALWEVRRVIKPGGVFYLDLHPYTSIHGDHDFRSTVPPWNHLCRNKVASWGQPCYVNKVSLAEWRDMLRGAFSSVQFLEIDGEAERNRKHLTDDIRCELNHYTAEELLMTTFIAVARKN